ncbi:hypothetical protein F5Y09DRAFT_300121 [Xylaria sp. FL1042]|nr:hypothetical protein F5Y09DRAFT_300121 [Xylaria sp. FL1042]
MPIVPGTYWDLLDRTIPPIKRRATHSKARTGCLTCKRRKVKCDEAKPACTRCAKSGHRCAGYEAPPAPVRKGGADGGGNHSKYSVDRYTLLRPKPEASLNLVRASLTPSYLGTGEAHYFERFKSQVIADLGAWCGAEYWRSKILRDVLTDKTVQHAALGAAAMLMDIEEQQHDAYARKISRRRSPSSAREGPMTEEGILQTTTTTPGFEEEKAEGEEEGDIDPLPPVTPLTNRSAHGKAALHHYTASIALCRQTLASEGITSATARPSLAATFFYAIFELIQGNVGEADRLINHGISLLDGNPAVFADGELREIQLGFDKMRVTWELCPYFGAPCAKKGGGALKGDYGARHFELPSADASVRTKQVFWNAFSSEFGRFMVDVQGIISRTITTTTSSTSPSSPLSAEEKRAALPIILAQRTYYLTQLQYWLPILEDLCASDPRSAILCTTKVYAQTAIIFLNCFLDPSELAYDAYDPIFTDIVSTYERLLPSPNHHTHAHSEGYLRFTLDTDLFHIITFTVSKCRARTTRQRALRVFSAMTRHQALWTNSGMLMALRALADLEDKGRRSSDGFVPPEARYSYVDSEWDFERRRTMAVFVPVLSNVDGAAAAAAAAESQSGESGGGASAAGIVRVPIEF